MSFHTANPGTGLSPAKRWLTSLEAALAANSQAGLSALFSPDAYWRDLIAFTGSVITFSQANAIAHCACAGDARRQSIHRSFFSF